jgi:hypothetical protein
MTKNCKVSVEKPRKSSRTTKSPFKLNEKETKLFDDPIILVSDPSSEAEDKASYCIEEGTSYIDVLNNSSDLDDFISAYYSDAEEKGEEEEVDKDPNGEGSYLKLKGILETFLIDLTTDESGIEEDDRERDYVFNYRAHMEEQGQTNNTGNKASVIQTTDSSNNRNNTNSPEEANSSLLLESDFIDMIERFSQILIMKYILKVLNYLRNLQLITENENIKKRIAIFFKYIEDMPDSEIRKDCDDLRKDLVELNGGKDLENFPQSGVILIDLIDGSNAGLSSEELSKLSSHKYSGFTNQDKCCICMSDIEEGDDVINLIKCSHEYHATCIVSWLKISDKCPICREIFK